MTVLYCTYTESWHDKQQNYAFTQNRRGVGYKYGAFRSFVGMGILWDSHRFSYGYQMGMGIEI